MTDLESQLTRVSALTLYKYNILFISRDKRSPGDGIAGLVKDAAELTPLDDMKEAYKYKVNNNPEFKVSHWKKSMYFYREATLFCKTEVLFSQRLHKWCH